MRRQHLAVTCKIPCMLVLLVSTIGSKAVAVETERLGIDELRVYQPGALPDDKRLDPLKDLDGYFPFLVPPTVEAWEKRAEKIRRQVLVATGLWPMPERTPLNPVIHGKVHRDGFTVEKVYFESMPNHFVTGLLFRPDDGKQDVRRPAVLCPHGHGGRMQDYGADKMSALIEAGAEKYEQSGRFPKLARCAHLARMGCVAFIFDMLGYEDSQQISYELAHRFAKQRPEFEGNDLEGNRSWGLYSAQAEMRLQSIMGIQTWNGVRCLDFLQQLPDVDPSRIGVTGGSGGGTQTILLCAIDPRPVVAFPNGMVSTSMQGGCTCENCSLLRIDTGNVELAGLFAPKPQAMTAADDWTKEMMTKGYPELQQLYGLLGVRDDVFCRPLLQFPHNYNYVSRATMYDWFNRHLGLNLSDHELTERDFPMLTKDETTVWNAQHPRPAGGDQYERELTRYLTSVSAQQMAELEPSDSESLQRFQQIVGGALQTVIGRELPSAGEITREKVDERANDTFHLSKDILRFKSKGEEFPILSLSPLKRDWSGDVVIWVTGQGKAGVFDADGMPLPEVSELIEAGAAVISADLFQQGEFLADEQPVTRQRTVDNPREAAAFSFGYNPTLFVRRVHDVLSLISFVVHDEHAPQRVMLVGTDGGGPLAAAARMISGSAVDKAAIESNGFRFAKITDYHDPNFVPGVVKYGDLSAVLALNAPEPLMILGEESLPLVASAYAAATLPQHLTLSSQANTVVQWLLQE